MTYANTANYEEQGGGRTVIGGEIDIVSGGALKVAGTDRTAALATAPAAVASGYMIARGETALDGSNPTPVVTGLTTITGFSATLKGSAAPGVGTTTLTYTASGGTVSVYAWKPTSNADPTLIASTGTETFGWVAVGT
jgi:hypothetical protein